ncbi:unnamed protein product [Soboliphyme baturini]|uniref:TOG domain-containing protein n=1 Tax=Soboliphyme baturini TaxID=241478 RepID=A0A183IK67_9BILA|nr:unnamed protein product [Soboliphyme baturini]
MCLLAGGRAVPSSLVPNPVGGAYKKLGRGGEFPTVINSSIHEKCPHLLQLMKPDIGNGNDLQRIVLVRSMFGLLLNKEDRLLDVLSILQELLCSPTSIEFQFEIGEAYKFLLEKVNDLAAEVNLQIVRNILRNINSNDSVTRAAWTELLLEAIDYLPKGLLLSEILPEALKKARAGESVLAKITGSKFLGRQATRLDEADVRSYIVPVIQALCKDTDAAVRASASKQIPVIAKALKLKECLPLLMPTIIDLSTDESDLVQEANLEAVVFFLNNVDNGNFL